MPGERLGFVTLLAVDLVRLKERVDCCWNCFGVLEVGPEVRRRFGGAIVVSLQVEAAWNRDTLGTFSRNDGHFAGMWYRTK